MGKLEFFSLLNCKKHEKYNKKFSDLTNGEFFNVVRLKNELSDCIPSSKFKNTTIFVLVKLMMEDKLNLELTKEYLK